MKTKIFFLTALLFAGILPGQTQCVNTSFTGATDNGLKLIVNSDEGTGYSNVNAYTCYQEAIEFAKEEHYNASLNSLEKALNLDPKFAQAYDYKAVIYIKIGKFVRALKAANDAISCNDKFAEAYNHRGIVHLYLQNSDKALADYSAAIELNPQYATAYYNRGLLKLTNGDDSGALLDLSKARDLKCQDADPVIREFLAEK
jgi:tetratricopeptide (TPR) repeat protein